MSRPRCRDGPSMPAADPMKKDAVAAPTTRAAAGSVQASPFKSAAEELDALRKTLRAACQQFAKRLDMEIIRVRERVAVAGEQHTASAKNDAVKRVVVPGSSQLYDVRDMITLLRTLEVKPTAGRRKDLKKIESLVDELRLLVERWG